MDFQKTYLFYDIETTGLNKCFDQVLQFAAIRTDLELNELDQTEITIKLNSDVIPSPGAIITHQIGINDMMHGEKEINGIQHIHHLLNQPGTISTGYNTLGFDDEFLRFSFYRNLLPPYTHQFANQCGRMDLYPIIALFFLFKRDALKWPHDFGEPSLTLDNITRANKLDHGRAHNALVDVQATLRLARHLIKYRKMWDYIMGYFNKSIDLNRIQQHPISISLEQLHCSHAIMISTQFGHRLKYHAPVLFIGQHQHYKNQWLWLRLDDERLTQVNSDNIQDNTFVMRKRAGEPPIILPATPRYQTHLCDERKQLTTHNLNWLSQNPTLLQSICDFHQHHKYPYVPNIDADAALYDIGFASTLEESLFKKFHQANPNDKKNIANQFPNPIRHEQAFRLLARHYPEYLSEEQKQTFANYLLNMNNEKSAPIDYRGLPHLTTDLALEKIELLCHENDLNQAQKTLLLDLKSHLNQN